MYGPYKLKLQEILTPDRYAHTMRTVEMSLKLAEHIGHTDANGVYLAALMHDVAKCHTREQMLELARKYNIETDEYTRKMPYLLHASVGAYVARHEFGITNEEVLGAVACHTMGKENMSQMEKIVFLADLIEDGRMYEGAAELRALAFADFDKALIGAFDRIIKFVLHGGSPLHPTTVAARNFLVCGLEKKENRQ